MITVRLEALEFMDALPVVGASVDLTVKVAPRFSERFELPDTDDRPGTGEPGGGRGTTPGTIALARGGATSTVFVPRYELGEAFTSSGITDDQGSFTATFDVDDAFARAALQRLEDRTDPPHDVVGVLEVRIRVAGLDRRVPYVGGIGMEQSVNLLPADANVTRVLAIDFAKTIVGHTTPTSALLWFNLLASVVTSGSYVCEVRARSSGDEVVSVPLDFDEDDPRIATADLTGLTPGETYGYSLALLTSSLGPGDIDISVATEEAGGGRTRRVGVSRIRPEDVGPTDAGTAAETVEARIHPGIPRDRRELARGEFTTPAADATGLTLVFGSCHRPTWDETLERWHALSRRTDYELALLIGDQIYEDEIMPLGDTWFERYVGRYHQFFSYWPVREVMRRTPMYMIFDDHDVKDDWGITEVHEQGRVEAALDAYRRFQQAHNPGGADRPAFHYDFTWGPAAFFAFDCRSHRVLPPEDVLEREEEWDDAPRSVVLGEAQLDDLRAWARRPETQAADIIVLMTSVPLAFLPAEEVIRLLDEIEDAASDAGAEVGVIGGAVVGGLIGLAVGGPAGAAAGAIIGADLAGIGGAYAGHAYAASEISDAGFADLTSNDLADVWTWGPNQPDLAAVLEVLFDLASDVQPDGSQGGHPRAVIVLGGDVHSGSMHLIRSFPPERGEHRHAQNPLMYQVTSSPISKNPATNRIYETVIRHITPGVHITEMDLLSTRGDFDALAEAKFGDRTAAFFLDDQLDRQYGAEFFDLITERNFGRIEIERADPARRVYRIFLTVEGLTHAISRGFQVDLDASPVVHTDLFQGVAGADGRLTLLRAHDVGTAFGPPADRLDAEVIVKLDTKPDFSFGFQLRNDGNEAVHEEMLDTLRESYVRGGRVRVEYEVTGRRSGRVFRVLPLD